MASKLRENGGSTGRRFQYVPRTQEDVERRATARGGGFDQYTKPEFTVFQPRDGANLIRIMPPTWEDPRHYGFDVFVHYAIGPDNATYLCLDKMLGKPCPLCEARNEIAPDDEEAARDLRPSQRVLYWVIDRDAEAAGPQLWAAPFQKVDKEISALSMDRRKGGIIAIDHPEKGYDIEFRKEGQKKRTVYTGIRIAREATPLAADPDEQDGWLDYIAAHPLPECLNYQDADYLTRIFGGGKVRREDDDAEPRGQRHARRGGREEEEPEVEDRRSARGARRDEEAAPEERVERSARRREPEEEADRPRRARLRPGDDDPPFDVDEEKPLDERAGRDRGRAREATPERGARSARPPRDVEEDEVEEAPDRETEGRSRRRGR